MPLFNILYDSMNHVCLFFCLANSAEERSRLRRLAYNKNGVLFWQIQSIFYISLHAPRNCSHLLNIFLLGLIVKYTTPLSFCGNFSIR